MMSKLMNFKSLLLLPVFVIFMASCEKDKDGGSNANDIVGNWTITKSEMSVTVNGIDFVQYLINELGLSQSEAEAYEELFFSEITGTVNIKSDGTYEANFEGEITTGTWELSSDNKKITMDKGTEDEMVMNVESLSSSKLVLSYEESETDDMNSDGTDDTILAKVKLTFSK